MGRQLFRGDPVSQSKPPGEFRIFLLGGSAVEDKQPDVDMWTTHLRNTLRDPFAKVVNAGQSGMGSTTAVAVYDYKIRRFSPDLVLYYEALNEQLEFSRWAEVNRLVQRLTDSYGIAILAE